MSSVPLGENLIPIQRAVSYTHLDVYKRQDLSRLGRNYLQTGTLIEDFFPRHGVRYIAMNDGIDTCLLYTSRCV